MTIDELKAKVEKMGWNWQVFVSVIHAVRRLVDWTFDDVAALLLAALDPAAVDWKARAEAAERQRDWIAERPDGCPPDTVLGDLCPVSADCTKCWLRAAAEATKEAK